MNWLHSVFFFAAVFTNIPANSASIDDDLNILQKQKVVVRNGDVGNFKADGGERLLSGRYLQFKTQTMRRGSDCFKLVTIIGGSSRPSISDKVKIACDIPEPDKRRGYTLNYGNIIFEQYGTEVVYVVKDGYCEKKDGWNPDILNRLSDADCDKLTKKTRNERKSGVIPDLLPPSPEDYAIINRQKVVVLNGNVRGYQAFDKPVTVTGHSLTLTTQKYTKGSECVKLVTITKSNFDGIYDQVKIACDFPEPDKQRGYELRFDGIIIVEYQSTIVYVVKDGECIRRNYYVSYDLVEKTDKKLSTQDCDKVSRRSLAERKSGIIPGTEPLVAEDFKAMRDQLASVLKKSVKGCIRKGSKSSLKSKSYNVDTQEFNCQGQCVKQVSFGSPNHDQYYDQIFVTCDIKQPVIMDDVEAELNYGNVLFLVDQYDAVFIMPGGTCLKRDYYVYQGEVEKKNKYMSTQDCYQLTRWRLAERQSKVRLNKNPPSRKEVPASMTLLRLDGSLASYSGYKQDPGVSSISSGNNIGFYTRDYTKGADDCVRLLTIKYRDVVMDEIVVTCGPVSGMNISPVSMRYGSMFWMMPGEGSTYKALFNPKDGSCVQRVYTVSQGVKTTVTKSADKRVSNQQCTDLINNKNNNNGNFVISGGSFNQYTSTSSDIVNNNDYIGGSINFHPLSNVVIGNSNSKTNSNPPSSNSKSQGVISRIFSALMAKLHALLKLK